MATASMYLSDRDTRASFLFDLCTVDWRSSFESVHYLSFIIFHPMFAERLIQLYIETHKGSERSFNFEIAQIMNALISINCETFREMALKQSYIRVDYVQ